MILEQLIFTVFAVALFVYMFFKMIKTNDSSYVVLLIVEVIGIIINTLEILFGFELNMLIKIIAYLLAIIAPIIMIALEKKNISVVQYINVIIAKIFVLIGKNKIAKSELINLINKYPDSYLGHKTLAQIYEKEGGMRKAIDEYVQAIDINKTDYDSYYKIAELLIDLNKKDESIEILNNLLIKKPDYYKATEALGDILIEKEMYKDAEKVYTDALKYNPTNYDIYYNLGIIYTMLNDFQNSKICYEKAAELNSISFITKYSLAELALIYKDLEEAEKYFLEVKENPELEADAYYELAKINMLKGEKDLAINYANIAVESNNKRIIEKLKRDPIFIPIISKISIPFNIEEEEKEISLDSKEIIAKEHLEDMCEKTRTLTYNDIKLLKENEKQKETEQEKLKKNEIQIDENEIDKY